MSITERADASNRSNAMKERLKTAWQVLNCPSIHYSLGFLTVGGFIAGVIFWGCSRS
jgi:hypothetical protein